MYTSVAVHRTPMYRTIVCWFPSKVLQDPAVLLYTLPHRPRKTFCAWGWEALLHIWKPGISSDGETRWQRMVTNEWSPRDVWETPIACRVTAGAQRNRGCRMSRQYIWHGPPEQDCSIALLRHLMFHAASQDTIKDWLSRELR